MYRVASMSFDVKKKLSNRNVSFATKMHLKNVNSLKKSLYLFNDLFMFKCMITIQCKSPNASVFTTLISVLL